MINNKVFPQTESTYKELQPFNNVDQMNAAIKEHKEAYDLSKTDRNILDVISCYACKFPGVAYLSKAKIANEAGYKNRRTAIRACNRLEDLGVIVQHETRRVSGDRRRSSDIIVINDVVTGEEHKQGKALEDTQVTDNNNQVTPDSHSLETFTKTIKPSNTSETIKGATSFDIETLIHNAIPNSTPSILVDMLSPFFYGSELYKYIGIIFKAKYRKHVHIRIEEHADAFKTVISDVILRYKKGYIKSLERYLYKSIKRLSRELYFKDMAEYQL